MDRATRTRSAGEFYTKFKCQICVMVVMITFTAVTSGSPISSPATVQEIAPSANLSEGVHAALNKTGARDPVILPNASILKAEEHREPDRDLWDHGHVIAVLGVTIITTLLLISVLLYGGWKYYGQYHGLLAAHDLEPLL